MQPDDTWISISGEVESVDPREFLLDYGDGAVTVEMDDFDLDADAFVLNVGDHVTVHGLVDDDFFETTSIEASSVYVEELGTYFYSSVVDEEDTFVTLTTPVVVSETTVQGTVTSITGMEFTVDAGVRQFTVDTSELGINIFDDEGFLQVEVGDRVTVTGTMDEDFFGDRELEAEAVVNLSAETQ
jgi:predicted extracellular nuclease